MLGSGGADQGDDHIAEGRKLIILVSDCSRGTARLGSDDPGSDETSAAVPAFVAVAKGAGAVVAKGVKAVVAKGAGAAVEKDAGAEVMTDAGAAVATDAEGSVYIRER